MKKLLVILIMFIGTINISAQENNEAILQKIDSLQSQLNELQIDYEFHKLESELQKLYIELKTYCNNMNIKTNGILINCHQGNANKTLYEAYKESYDIQVSRLNTYKEVVNIIKSAIHLKTYEIKFTDKQLSTFDKGIKTMNSVVDLAEHSLNQYKTFMSMYKDLIR